MGMQQGGGKGKTGGEGCVRTTRIGKNSRNVTGEERMELAGKQGQKRVVWRSNIELEEKEE